VRRRLLVLVGLLTLNLASAVAVVESTYTTRQLTHQLQSARLTQDRIAAQWAQIQLENSTWASPDRVAGIARDDFGMIQPRNYVVLGDAP
jgi:cell division protein FtsL